ncbi:MAG TPA: hypothetical protein VH575_25260 [Gemmataceae bacterium]|jgi:hypothetical protein
MLTTNDLVTELETIAEAAKTLAGAIRECDDMQPHVLARAFVDAGDLAVRLRRLGKQLLPTEPKPASRRRRAHVGMPNERRSDG